MSLSAIEITFEDLVILRDYLLAHEDDIEGRINDFGSLHKLFVRVVGREPKSAITCWNKQTK